MEFLVIIQIILSGYSTNYFLSKFLRWVLANSPMVQSIFIFFPFCAYMRTHIGYGTTNRTSGIGLAQGVWKRNAERETWNVKRTQLTVK